LLYFYHWLLGRISNFLAKFDTHHSIFSEKPDWIGNGKYKKEPLLLVVKTLQWIVVSGNTFSMP
jgi:hypothetical protein